MKSHKDVLQHSKYALQRLVPAKVIQSRLHRRIFEAFADKVGLVYFGYVDQRHDDHSLIRGVTVSTKHRDNHYCVGSFEGYDVSLVERVDTIRHPGKTAKMHSWIIMTFDLHQTTDIPYVFLGSSAQSEAFYAQLFTKLPHIVKLPLGQTATYDHAFLQRYAIFAKPEQALAVEQLFHPALAKEIGNTFHGLAIEIHEGTLYLYAEQQRATATLLAGMLTRGIWLAQVLDQQAEASTSS